MVMRKDDIEYTIYPSGKFLIKPAEVGGTLSRDRAEVEANTILRVYSMSGDAEDQSEEEDKKEEEKEEEDPKGE
jgi:hypothetical protein